MTSPIGNKPVQDTKGKYDGVHGKGSASSFGQGLNEARVREILGQEVKSPFGRFLENASKFFGGLVNDIASAIRGDGGAKYTVITGAVDERLGPMETAIGKSGEHFAELAEKADATIREQDRIHDQMVEKGKEIEQARKELEQAQRDRAAAEAKLRNEIADTLRKAESAQKSADGKSTIYYGTKTPKSPKSGDTWFKQVSGGSQILQFDGKRWVQRSDFAKFEKDLADNKSAVDQAAKDVAKAEAKVKNLVEVELPKISAGTAKFNRDLADEKKAREKALKNLDDEMSQAQKDLDELELSRPGNIFPDPFFKHPAWHSTAQPKEGGLVIRPGTPSNTVWWKGDRMIREVPVEPGASYLVTMDVKQPNTGRKIEFMTLSYHASTNTRIYTHPSMKKVGEGKDGAVVMSGIVTFPDTIDGRCSVAIKAFFNKGDKDVWVDNVRMVRAADNAMIIDGAITAKKIQAGAIETNHLEADAVKAGKIASDAVTARELKANSIYSKHIVSNQITGEKISSKTITGENIQAGSITANELQIRPGNLFPDPHFKDPCWGTSAPFRSGTNNGGELCFFPNGTLLGGYYQPKGLKDQSMVLDPGVSYKLSATVQTNTASYKGKHVAIFVRRTKTDGKTTGARVGYLPISVHGTGHSSCIIKMPSDMKNSKCTIGFYTEKSMNGGRVSLWDVHLTHAADASLIVDGAILAKHIKAGEITSKQIAADTITGKNLKADQITGREVKSGTINANQLKVDNGFIKTAMIGNGQITNAKIGNLDAGKITTGVMDGKYVKADTITVKQLRANSIIPIGGSLIAHEPPPNDPTKPPEPIWWQALDKELEADYEGWPRPDGHPWRMANAGSYKNAKVTTPKRLMRVQPGKKYRVRFWARATGPGSKMCLEMRDQNNSHAVAKGTISDGQAQNWVKDGWRLEDHSGSRHKNQLIWNWTVPSVPTLVETMIEFNPDVEYVYLGALWYNDGYNRGERTTTTPQNQWIAGLSIDLDVPDQEQVDRLQTENIRRLGETVALNTKFVDQQKKTNRLVQNQQWVHQDMIELLDIRIPKLYGWPTKYSKGGNSEVTCPYNNRKGYYIETPFYEQWECGSGKGSAVVIASRGRWTGWMHVSINWDSGVVDDWAVPVNPKERIFSFTGGAHHINIRSISVEVYPRSLNRKATIILFDDKGSPPENNFSGDRRRKPKKWDSYDDKNRLFRHMLTKRIRLKNTVTCNRNVWVRDEEGKRLQIKAGENIYATEIYPEDQDFSNNTIFTFTEVDDPVRMDAADNFGYEVGKERPSGTPKSYSSRVK
ncbi:hypothetical protein LA324_05465 [Corynebacterium coyleae]|uniref:hypothetical protein n=1 Tax=Corynebacterium coyleae TaxID=53374 RepID=UPI001CCBC496|nr:hypothetical protein [Corynebacterium coyleae]UBI10058.1 hypothetical protein LA324_05465 [Corynebacterium coyleae]